MSNIIVLVSLYTAQATESSCITANFEKSSSCGDKIEISRGWGGEYPGQVVDVQKKVTLDARTGPCSFATISCTIKPGLYHPWSQSSISATNYISVSPKRKYVSEREIKHHSYRPLKTTIYPKGTIFEHIRYVGEGYCLYRVDGQDIQYDCPDMLKDEILTLVSQNKNTALGNETWEMLSVQCEEGHLGWLRVDDKLFQQNPSVKKGAITGYGTIGPHGSRGI